MGEGLIDDRRDPVADVRADLDRLDPTTRAVFEGLTARRFATAEEVAARSGVSALDVIRALPALDAAALVERGATGFRIAARVRAKPPASVVDPGPSAAS
jgi:DNA processing protein